jgi:Xaa-Pro aminopeptidase
MRQAGAILARARHRIFSSIKSGITERQVANALSASILEEGADEVAFVHVNSGKLHT